MSADIPIKIKFTVQVEVTATLDTTRDRIEKWIISSLDPHGSGDVTAKVKQREVAT